jgi:hypothetical protein
MSDAPNHLLTNDLNISSSPWDGRCAPRCARKGEDQSHSIRTILGVVIKCLEEQWEST